MLIVSSDIWGWTGLTGDSGTFLPSFLSLDRAVNVIFMFVLGKRKQHLGDREREEGRQNQEHENAFFLFFFKRKEITKDVVRLTSQVILDFQQSGSVQCFGQSLLANHQPPQTTVWLYTEDH